MRRPASVDSATHPARRSPTGARWERAVSPFTFRPFRPSIMSGCRSSQQQQARRRCESPATHAAHIGVARTAAAVDISNRDGSWCVGAGEIVHSASATQNSPLTLDINAARNHMLWCPNGSPFMPSPSLSLRRCVTHWSLIGQPKDGRGSGGSTSARHPRGALLFPLQSSTMSRS